MHTAPAWETFPAFKAEDGFLNIKALDARRAWLIGLAESEHWMARTFGSEGHSGDYTLDARTIDSSRRYSYPEINSDFQTCLRRDLDMSRGAVNSLRELAISFPRRTCSRQLSNQKAVEQGFPNLLICTLTFCERWQSFSLDTCGMRVGFHFERLRRLQGRA